MSDFSFLNNYIIPSEKMREQIPFVNFKHYLFPESMETVHDVERSLDIPTELREFYSQIGYGFFYPNDGFGRNRLLDCDSLKSINLKKDEYEYDPDLKIYDTLYGGDKILFFEIMEGKYLAIDKAEVDGKNSIYYYEKQIAMSLEDFLIRLDSDTSLIEQIELI